MTVTCSPQRYLANNRNLLRTATLTPSSVLPVANNVLPIPFARKGTAVAALTGTYTGDETATYDFEIIDTDVEVPRISQPTFFGQGSGTIDDISASGTPQTFTVECTESGIQGAAAAVTVDGARIEAKDEGTAGNLLRITVDTSTLVFTDSDFTTIVDLEVGQGGDQSPMIGEGFDWGQAQIDSNNVIPAGAVRIAFADDHSQVYLPYKKFDEGGWKYFLIPALQRAVPKGTRIQYVTGGRTVVITDGTNTEMQSGIITDFDFLNWIRTTSTLVVVDGPVTNDRTPTGQAAREFSLRTDAHAGVSSGSSENARGLESVSVSSTAGTQLVTFTCFAVNSGDNPNARLGHELWAVKSSLNGALGTAITGVPFVSTDFSATVPVRLPDGFGEDKGSIGGHYEPVSRADDEVTPDVCIVGLALGPEATDKTITFRYSPAPSEDCDCTGLRIPPINATCLGTPGEGGASVSYEDDTNTRLTAMRLWERTIVRELSKYGAPELLQSALQAPVISNPTDGTGGSYAQATQSLKQVLDNFEQAIAQIDVLTPSSPPGYREAGMTAWDDALTEFQDDIEAAIGGSSPPSDFLLNMPSDRYTASIAWALASAGIANVGKSDASTVSGDGCWRDLGGPRWVDVSGTYAPLFTNERWYLSRPTVKGDYFSTHEATGIINVKCEGDLKFGDEVIITILNAGYGSTYQVGDVIELPIIAASALFLTGGVDAALTQTWNVNGSVAGPFPQCTFNPDAPTAYSQTVGGDSVAFQLTEGGIPFAKGDRFRFAVEGGHFRWRKNGGAWSTDSPPLPIPLTSTLIDEGLSVSWATGAAASFVEGDVYKFKADQPWAVSHVQTPGIPRWKGDGTTWELAFDLGSAQDWDIFAMAHGLPADATVTLWGGATSGATDFSDPIDWREGVMWAALEARNARYGRIVISLPTGESGWVRWAWLGTPLTTKLSAQVQLSLSFKLNEPGGNLQGGRFVGKGVSGSVQWTERALDEDDAADLAALITQIKMNNNEPFILIPQVTRPDAHFVFANSNDVEFNDRMAYNQDASITRRVSASFPLEGVWQ